MERQFRGLFWDVSGNLWNRRGFKGVCGGGEGRGTEEILGGGTEGHGGDFGGTEGHGGGFKGTEGHSDDFRGIEGHMINSRGQKRTQALFQGAVGGNQGHRGD